MARYPSFGVEVNDPGVLVDVDTESDLAALRATAASSLSSLRTGP
jgi:molybdenum cofactor cytidylyltransferase